MGLVSLVQNIDSVSAFQVPFVYPEIANKGVFGYERVPDTVNQSGNLINSLLPVNKPATGHFLQQTKVVFNIIDRPDTISDWVTVFFLGILLVVTLIWYFFPERVFRLLSKEGSKHKLKYSDNQFAKPGIFLYLLYLITFFSTTIVFLLSVLNLYYPDFFIRIEFTHLIIGVSIAVILYYLSRMIVIYLIGFVFRTQKLASKQIQESFRIDLIQGFLLIPILIIYLNMMNVYVLYVGIFLLISIYVYKLFLSVIIGLKSSKISLYHNILYLCTLEIIPVIVLVKLMESYRIVF